MFTSCVTPIPWKTPSFCAQETLSVTLCLQGRSSEVLFPADTPGVTQRPLCGECGLPHNPVVEETQRISRCRSPPPQHPLPCGSYFPDGPHSSLSSAPARPGAHLGCALGGSRAWAGFFLSIVLPPPWRLQHGQAHGRRWLFAKQERATGSKK